MADSWLPDTQPCRWRNEIRCTATVKNGDNKGQRCQKLRVGGIHGTICDSHGGKTGRNVNAVAVRKSEHQIAEIALKYDADPNTDPWTALAQIVGEVILRERLLFEQAKTGDQAAIQAHDRCQHQLSRLLLDVSKLDLDERRIRVSTIQLRQLSALLRGAVVELFDVLREQAPHPNLPTILTDEWPAILRRHLKANE